MKKIKKYLSCLGVLFILSLSFTKAHAEKVDDISQLCNETNYKKYIYDHSTVYGPGKGCSLKNWDLDLEKSIWESLFSFFLGKVNLSGADLRELDLSDTMFDEGSNFSNANLINANLEDAFLENTNLSKANLSNA